jgi:UDP-N-acetylmuramoyl-L-alanyl-D-glutamate--2,6-diaminopimelate ligase
VISNTIHGLEMDIFGHPTWFQLVGDFNASNLLAVAATAKLLEQDEQEVLIQLSTLAGVSGRFERIESSDGITAIVDYAHTPDALLNVLKTLKEILGGKDNIITVVGCGGNRDKEKRPAMAEIAVKNSGKIIFTSDNPRNEDPEIILDEMIAGLGATYKKRIQREVNRETAIKQACAMAKPGDVILIAGKGHENYQEILFLLFVLLAVCIAVMSFLRNYSLIPVLGMLCCAYLMIEIPAKSWLVFFGWMGVGLLIYFFYGMRHSKLN